MVPKIFTTFALHLKMQSQSGKTQCGRRRPDVVRCKGFNIMKNKKGKNKMARSDIPKAVSLTDT